MNIYWSIQLLTSIKQLKIKRYFLWRKYQKFLFSTFYLGTKDFQKRCYLVQRKVKLIFTYIFYQHNLVWLSYYKHFNFLFVNNFWFFYILWREKLSFFIYRIDLSFLFYFITYQIKILYDRNFLLSGWRLNQIIKYEFKFLKYWTFYLIIYTTIDPKIKRLWFNFSLILEFLQFYKSFSYGIKNIRIYLLKTMLREQKFMIFNTKRI